MEVLVPIHNDFLSTKTSVRIVKWIFELQHNPASMKSIWFTLCLLPDQKVHLKDNWWRADCNFIQLDQCIHATQVVQFISDFDWPALLKMEFEACPSREKSRIRFIDQGRVILVTLLFISFLFQEANVVNYKCTLLLLLQEILNS